MKYAIIILCVYVIFLIVRSNAHSRTKTDIKYFPYKKKHLLTKAEYVFYNELAARTKKYNIIICPKVRMADFIDVTDIQNRQKYRGYLKSRHVDFLLCDSKLNILGAIELDDPSHNYESVQRTDDFKNKVYNAIGVKLYRITYQQEYDLQITNVLKDLTDRYKKQN